MDKLKKIWNIAYTPALFFIGGMCFLVNEPLIGCLFILVGTNQVIDKD